MKMEMEINKRSKLVRRKIIFDACRCSDELHFEDFDITSSNIFVPFSETIKNSSWHRMSEEKWLFSSFISNVLFWSHCLKIDFVWTNGTLNETKSGWTSLFTSHWSESELTPVKKSVNRREEKRESENQHSIATRSIGICFFVFIISFS